MRFRLVYTHRAARDIDGLDSRSRERIGDYRVIFDIEGNDIVVLRIGHRPGLAPPPGWSETDSVKVKTLAGRGLG